MVLANFSAMGPPEGRPLSVLAAIFQNGVQYALVTRTTSITRAVHIQTVYVGVCAHGDIQNYADSAK